MSFQEILIQKRKEQGLSVYSLSARSGVPKSTIFSYEKGVSPTLDKADKLLTALGVSMRIGSNEEDKK